MVDYLNKLLAEASWWDVVGYTGQLIFFSRFLVQWIASERRRESVVPISFWYLSILGSLICLAYALTTFKIPFILAYLFNCIPYVRNLMLIYAKRAKDAPAPKELVCKHCGEHVEEAVA